MLHRTFAALLVFSVIASAADTRWKELMTPAQHDRFHALVEADLKARKLTPTIDGEGMLTIKSHTVNVHNLAGLIKLAGFDSAYLDQIVPEEVATPRAYCRAS